MKDSPDAVCIYIPLMKHLGMSWADIKGTPRIELEGIMAALGEYNLLHSFDGYNEKEISEMSKNKPEVRSRYGEYVAANRRLKEKLGQKIERPSFKGLLG